jgi:uncharacterized membrane protein
VTTETARIEAFSDGVFAIAITLLILEIKIPPAGSGAVTHELLQEWPSFVSYLLSFAFIGIMWMNHHRLFTLIKRSDHLLMILNLLLLLGVTTVPFPTAVLGVDLGHPGQRAAMVFFSATYLYLAIVFYFLWRYAASSHRHLLGPDVDRQEVENITRQYMVGPALYLLCFILAWISVPSSLGLNIALAFFFALPPHIAPNLGPRRRTART